MNGSAASNGPPLIDRAVYRRLRSIRPGGSNEPRSEADRFYCLRIGGFLFRGLWT
ncbi:MAG: hypothetical protein JXA41_02770 [Deltaproteobacteria bacterium]|nr:hypothetical protein [Deltaproteobacteria bacterium]